MDTLHDAYVRRAPNQTVCPISMAARLCADSEAGAYVAGLSGRTNLDMRSSHAFQCGQKIFAWMLR